MPIGCLVLSCAAHAQDSVKTTTLNEVVVTGTKFEIPSFQSGKVIHRLNESSLAQQQGRSVADVLNDLPSMHVDGIFSSPGTNVNYYVRGARNRQTLVLVDGVPMSDPTGIDLFFDLRFLPMEQFQSMEVLQGGLSTLYGSGAAAGVINLQRKSLFKDGVHGQAGVSYGSWNTLGQYLSLSGKKNKLSMQVSGSYTKSDGFSAALDETGNQDFDKDGFDRKNIDFSAKYDLSHSWSLTAFAGYDGFETAFDEGAFIDSNDENEQAQIRAGLRSDFSYAKGKLSLLTQLTDVERNFSGSFASLYEGKTFFSDLSHQHLLTKQITLLSGIQAQELRYDTLSFTMVDPYTSVLIDFNKGLHLHAGVRLNTHSEYASAFLYSINPSWLLSLSNEVYVKTQASLSTSYITPSLFQLYTPWGGNRNLKPESTTNYEYGMSLYIKNRFELSTAHFFRDEEQSIGYTNRYENLADTRWVRGLTIDGRYWLNEALQVSVDYAYTYTNKANSFFRIPKQKYGVGLEIKPYTGSLITLRYSYTGARSDVYYDASFNMNRVDLPSYQLIDLTLSQQFWQNRMTLRAGIYNVLDENFIGIYGFTTRGRNFSVGLNCRF